MEKYMGSTWNKLCSFYLLQDL